MKQFTLQLYRLGVVCLIAWLIRDLAVRQRTHGDSPIVVDEVAGFFASAVRLRPDDSARDGLFIVDREGRELGYVVRTQPQCQDIIGYAGVTDALVVLDREWKIVGIKIHSSDDTKDYVDNVVLDRRFLKKWNGMTWDGAAALDLEAAGIEGVSGATMTSMAIARSVKARLQMSRDEIIARPALRWGWRDWGMVVVLGLAAVRQFRRMGDAEERARRTRDMEERETSKTSIPAFSGVSHVFRVFRVFPVFRILRWKCLYEITVIVYVGFIAGDLVAQKFFAGWARAGVPWTTAPGLVLLTVAALLVPWTTRRPFYCHQICPHGAAQELINRVRPARWRINLPASVARGLEFLPAGLLLLVLVVAMLALPLDLAGIEPFAAYVVRSAGWATLAIAVIGLAVSFFVPQAYCRFGCPTGALLNFVRARGATDTFSRRDALALVFVAVAVAINWNYLAVISWIKG
ncbi:MAG: FMN-binding protein [Opitutaceae bacterium]|nr:FMN-binding protein [Opitutaceae bacterium]